MRIKEKQLILRFTIQPTFLFFKKAVEDTCAAAGIFVKQDDKQDNESYCRYT
jgi:hypothetical protein